MFLLNNGIHVKKIEGKSDNNETIIFDVFMILCVLKG
jgi:hypothetical protein